MDGSSMANANNDHIQKLKKSEADFVDYLNCKSYSGKDIDREDTIKKTECRGTIRTTTEKSRCKPGKLNLELTSMEVDWSEDDTPMPAIQVPFMDCSPTKSHVESANMPVDSVGMQSEGDVSKKKACTSEGDISKSHVESANMQVDSASVQGEGDAWKKKAHTGKGNTSKKKAHTKIKKSRCTSMQVDLVGLQDEGGTGKRKVCSMDIEKSRSTPSKPSKGRSKASGIHSTIENERSRCLRAKPGAEPGNSADVHSEGDSSCDSLEEISADEWKKVQSARRSKKSEREPYNKGQ